MNSRTKKTLVVLDRHAALAQRLSSAHERAHGTQVMTMNDFVARLAGGFTTTIDNMLLRKTVHEVLNETDLGDLDTIKDLPGFVHAATHTLHKAWYSGFDLQQNHPRVQAIARLERAILEKLPASMLRPSALIEAARARIKHAPAIFGSVRILGMTELHPCWWPLIELLCKHISVTWVAGPRHIPARLPKNCNLESAREENPEITAVSASTPYHEAIEAIRWARQMVVQKNVKPGDIAIASTDTTAYDDYFFALREESDLPLYFAHGVCVTNSPQGQATAALADMLLRGISADRLNRLSAHKRFLADDAKGFGKTWRQLSREIDDVHTLSHQQLRPRLEALAAADVANEQHALSQLLSEVTNSYSVSPEQNPTMSLADHVTMKRIWLRAGENLLKDAALTLWRRALQSASAASFEQTIAGISLQEPPEFCERVAWMPAKSLASSPRRYVRLLGLNSRHWPRENTGDRLLTGPGLEDAAKALDPLPVADADRRDFTTIYKTTTDSVTCSFARQDGDGKVLGKSHLLSTDLLEQTTRLFRNAKPLHAMSEADRLLAQPEDLNEDPSAKRALACWQNWRAGHVTEHDGLIRANHPLINHILSKPASATSLTRMLRAPLGYVWYYGLGWRGADIDTDTLTLNPKLFGNLVHSVLQMVLQKLNVNREAPNQKPLEECIREGVQSGMDAWETLHGTPPKLLWGHMQEHMMEIALRVFLSQSRIEYGASYPEIPFGSQSANVEDDFPWDVTASVILKGTDLQVTGSIDRLDIDPDNERAYLFDYKTGKPQKEAGLNGGREVQRCIYLVAAQALLGQNIETTARLLFVNTGDQLELPEPQSSFIDELASGINEAVCSLRNGYALFGATPENQSDFGIYGSLRLALPADLRRGYTTRKEVDVKTRLGNDLWSFWKTDT